jgi:cytochrome P450
MSAAGQEPGEAPGEDPRVVRDEVVGVRVKGLELGEGGDGRPEAGEPVADDVTVEALWDDPYPIYARMRAEAPVCYVPAVGLWFVTRWADVEFAADHPELFPASVHRSPLDRTLGGTNVLTVDGEAQRRLRDPLEVTLRPRAIEERAPAVLLALAEHLLDGLADRGEAELMTEYFEPFSVLSLARVIGLDDCDAPTLVRWFHGLATGTSNFEGDQQKQAIADATSADVDRALRPAFEERLGRRDDTMLSHLIHHVEGDLDARIAQVMPTLKLVLIGGLQEPGHGMGSTVYGLLRFAEQGRALAEDPGLVRRAVDEGLRWISPIGTQTRATAPGATLGGVAFPPGSNLGVLVSSANRDEVVWGPTAEDFDMFRPHRAHAAFGFGPHFCVGHYLARAQARIGIRMLFERLRGLRLIPERPPVVRGWEYRSPVHLHVRWDV